MSGNVHVRLREKGGGQKWPCCTSLSSSMGSALFFLGEYANMILMRCGALHLTFVGLSSAGACVPARPRGVRHEEGVVGGARRVVGGDVEGVEDTLKKFLNDPEQVVRESIQVALDMAEYEKNGEIQYALVPDEAAPAAVPAA